MRTRTVVRIVGYGLAFGLLHLAVIFFYNGRNESRKVDAARVAVRVQMPIDLSKAGEYAAPLHETFLNSHGAGFNIEITPPFGSSEEVEKALAGIEGNFCIKTAEGEPMSQYEFKDRLYPVRDSTVEGEKWIPCLAGIPSGRGEYNLIVHIASPAPGMAGKKQELVGRYQLCGMEEMPAMIGYVLAGLAACLAVVASMVTWRFTRAN